MTARTFRRDHFLLDVLVDGGAPPDDLLQVEVPVDAPTVLDVGAPRRVSAVDAGALVPLE